MLFGLSWICRLYRYVARRVDKTFRPIPQAEGEKEARLWYGTGTYQDQTVPPLFNFWLKFVCVFGEAGSAQRARLEEHTG